MFDYADFPREVVEDIVRLRRRIAASGVPDKMVDQNLLIASWNIFRFGQIHPSFDPNDKSPKRNFHALACIAEVIRHFDVVAIQEVLTDTVGVRTLLSDFLGPDWGIVLSDINAGVKGNDERLTYVYDMRRVMPSGLAGEIVIPPRESDDPEKVGTPVEQFDRAPYIVGFRAGDIRMTLLTAHIRFGKPDDPPEVRIPELTAFAKYVAEELRERSRIADAEEGNLLVLGDFNIDARGDNPLFQAFISTGLFVPDELRGLKTTTGKEAKFYDQIAWFQGDINLNFNRRAGVIDFVGAVFKNLRSNQLPSRISDHFPIWVEFSVDRSVQTLATKLGSDPFGPDPLGTDVVPD
jgi:hypothetical protein